MKIMLGIDDSPHSNEALNWIRAGHIVSHAPGNVLVVKHPRTPATVKE